MYEAPDDSPGPSAQFIQTRTVLCFGELTPALAQRVSQELLVLAGRSAAAIKLILSAQGGTLSTGEALYDLIAGLEAPVKTIGAGAVSEAAALAFVAPPLARRYCLPHARFSLHQPLSAPAQGDVLAAAELLAQHRRRLHALLARQTGQPLDRLARDTERVNWLNAEEAVGYGLVGQIVEGVGDI